MDAQLPAIFLRSAAVSETSQERDRVPLFVPANLLNDDRYDEWVRNCTEFERILHDKGSQNEQGNAYLMAVDAVSLMDRQLPNDVDMTARALRRRNVPHRLMEQDHAHGRDNLLSQYNWVHLSAEVSATFKQRLHDLQSKQRARELFQPTSALADKYKKDLTLFNIVFVEAAQTQVLEPKGAGEVAGSMFMRDAIVKSDYVFLHPSADAVMFVVVVSSRAEAEKHNLPWPPPDNQPRYVYVLACVSVGMPDKGRSMLEEAAVLAFMLNVNTVLFHANAYDVWEHYRTQGARFVNNNFREVEVGDWALRNPEVFPLTQEQILEENPDRTTCGLRLG